MHNSQPSNFHPNGTYKTNIKNNPKFSVCGEMAQQWQNWPKTIKPLLENLTHFTQTLRFWFSQYMGNNREKPLLGTPTISMQKQIPQKTHNNKTQWCRHQLTCLLQCCIHMRHLTFVNASTKENHLRPIYLRSVDKHAITILKVHAKFRLYAGTLKYRSISNYGNKGSTSLSCISS